MSVFDVLDWESPPGQSRTRRGIGSLGSRKTRAGAYELLSTPYGRRLCRGSGYRFRQPFRARIFGAAVVFLRIGGLIGLSLALPAQAHGPGSQGKPLQLKVVTVIPPSR